MANERIISPTMNKLAGQLQPQIRLSLAEMEVPGAVVIIRTRNGEWREAFGTRVRNGKTKMRIDDAFRIGSVTKTWTGTVILQMVQEGIIGLADPISMHVEGVPNGENITIEHLLNMRSGLRSYTTDPEFQHQLFSRPYQSQFPEALLDMALSKPALFAPGDSFDYSNTNTLLLGKVIEKRLQSGLSQIFHQRLFAPLGLKKSLFPPLVDTALSRPYAHGYTFDEGPVAAGADASVEDNKASGAAPPKDATYWSTSWAWAAGMGISTAPELSRMVEHMVKTGYLNEGLQKRRLDSCFATQPGAADYCWGMARFEGFYGHTGELPGYNNFMGHEPDTGTTLVIWTSLSETRDGKSPAVELAKLIIAALHKPAGQESRAPAALPESGSKSALHQSAHARSDSAQ